MKQRTRIYYTEAQKAEMWDHWEKGEIQKRFVRKPPRPHPRLLPKDLRR
jgi:IS30 family transposase